MLHRDWRTHASNASISAANQGADDTSAISAILTGTPMTGPAHTAPACVTSTQL